MYVYLVVKSSYKADAVVVSSFALELGLLATPWETLIIQLFFFYPRNISVYVDYFQDLQL